MAHHIISRCARFLLFGTYVLRSLKYIEEQKKHWEEYAKADLGNVTAAEERRMAEKDRRSNITALKIFAVDNMVTALQATQDEYP